MSPPVLGVLGVFNLWWAFYLATQPHWFWIHLTVGILAILLEIILQIGEHIAKQKATQPTAERSNTCTPN